MKITFIADTHHYSKTLGTTGKAYELRSGSDQKCLAETGEIIDSAFKQIAESDTDAVFILGDLSNNGERASHVEFREKLYDLKKSKPVFVITATHDWCCDGNPRRFDGDTVSNDVEVMRSDELPEFYKDFGPAQAIDSFITKIGTICYTVQLGNKLRVLCLNDDKNENDHAGFTEDCWQWIERQIENAKCDGCMIIGAEHHLLMPHISPLIAIGSVCVADRDHVASRFADTGLKYMFVGHSHMQSTAKFTSEKGNTITEVNVGSLCGYPAPIVTVTVNDNDTITYDVDHLKSVILNGREIEAMPFLAKHAANVINRVLECKTKEDFSERLSALQLSGKKLSAYWVIARPILHKLDTMLAYDVYKLLKAFGLAKYVPKAAVQRYHYKPLKDFIDEIFLSVLDGALDTTEKGSDYYELVVGVIRGLSSLKRDADFTEELIKAFDNALTGGEINNQHATI
ncbi:MAG: metallophosphoesterase [Eubacterium sp.]|nr:metallophosphoesterase [Eubacterium sp.]